MSIGNLFLVCLPDSLMHGLCQIYSRFLIKVMVPLWIRLAALSRASFPIRRSGDEQGEWWHSPDNAPHYVGRRATSASRASRGAILVCERTGRELVSKRHM